MKPRPVANLMRFRGPLAGSYPAAVALVVFALIPYLALSAAINPLLPVLSKSLPLSRQALELTNGMANAAYAFGTVMAVQFAVHRPGRRMLLLYAVLFVIGSVLAALAVTPGFFIVGHVLQGLTTSLMLIAAVPPLVIGWPTSKMPWTGFVMNLCIFGAVALGPVIGGVQAGAGDWRPLFWIVAAFGALCAGVRSADLRGPGPRRTYGIPGDRTGLPEGGDDVASGNNSFGNGGDNGPAPPPGHGPHHYYFWVYALDDELDLEPGLDRRALLERIEDHVIEQARVVGTYEH